MSYSAGEMYRMMKFYHGLTDKGIKDLVNVSNDLPMDHFAGLIHVHTVLWRNTRWLGLLALIGRMSLNLYTTAVMAHQSFDSYKGIKHTHGDDTQNYTTFSLAVDSLELCNLQFNWNKAHQDHCVHTPMSRLSASCVISFAEFFIVFLCYIITALSGLWYVFGPAGSEVGGTIASRSPLLFFVVPMFASKASAISFLQLLNTGRLKSLFLAGEGTYWWAWVAESLWYKQSSYIKEEGVGNAGAETDDEDESDSIRKTDVTDDEGIYPSRYHYLRMLVGAALCFGAIMLSFQAMLIKLTFVSFAALTSWETWRLADWLVAVGFLNQLAGLCWLEEVEMHRVLLFRFGGADAKWHWKECRQNVTYFRFLAMKITSGSAVGRAAALACMYTLRVDDIQKLLLSDQRDKMIQGEFEDRFKFFIKFFGDDWNSDFVKALEKFQDDKMQPKKERLQALKPALQKRLQDFNDFLKVRNGDKDVPEGLKQNISVFKIAIDQAYLVEECLKETWEVSSSDSDVESADTGAGGQENTDSDLESRSHLLSARRVSLGGED